jgi:hypothetical protein
MSGQPDPNAVSTAHALFFTENRREQAFQLLESEAARFPDRVDVMDFLSFLYASDGRYVDALRHFTQVAGVNPTPRCMANIVFCRTSIARCVLDGQPVNGPGPALALGPA